MLLTVQEIIRRGDYVKVSKKTNDGTEKVLSEKARVLYEDSKEGFLMYCTVSDTTIITDRSIVLELIKKHVIKNAMSD